ncbi:MAG: 5-deoxy-glucuronate isomerase [Actinomycetota bacterium]|jgi:5-deoxy-glucuronate isomerase|nr:5-deoxy-glucuronate isomerase [Actinomycetota bacterium]
MSEWHRKAGSASQAGYEVAIGPREAGWEHTGLNVLTLGPGESRTIAGREHEWLVLPLSGQVRVECGGKLLFLVGRAGPFAGPTDYVYVPVGSTFTITSTAGARIALPHAKASALLPFRRIPAEETHVELRGAGHSSRQVNNFATPSVLNADSIIACEVLTPAGNWSSYPPHKHDEHREDRESVLEEIYYFEMRTEAEAPGSGDAFGYQRVHGTNDRPINVLAEVHSGDVVLVPHGWHGPSMAPPGYDMYYLNVMAGPGARREWLAQDHPDHAWVRQTWASQKVDPRLPFGGRP